MFAKGSINSRAYNTEALNAALFERYATVSLTQAGDSITANGFASIAVSAALNQDTHTITSADFNYVDADLYGVQFDHTLSATGMFIGVPQAANQIYGALMARVMVAPAGTASQASDTVAGTMASTVYGGNVYAYLPSDTVVAAGTSAVSGAFSATQASNTAVGTLTTSIVGAAALTQASDTMTSKVIPPFSRHTATNTLTVHA